MSSAAPEADCKPTSVSLISLERLWPYLLAAVAGGALIPMVIRAVGETVDYDGFWHLFIASQDRWELFVSEYKGNAHPPIFMLLLRVVAAIGHSRLILRSISMAAGFGNICLIGVIAKQLCRDALIALLAATAYAFSITMVKIDVEVRSYALCLFFLLAAFYFFVDGIARNFDRHGRRSLLGWSVLSSLAIGTEYYAVFFVLACIACLALLLATRIEFNTAASDWTAKAWIQIMVALILPLATITYFHQTHIRYLPPNFAHVIDFYWTPGTSIIRFVLRNLRADLNFILPLEITSRAAFLAFLIISLPLIALPVILQREPAPISVAPLPVCMSVIILAELMAVSLLRRYPFGGFERQQSILFPFLFLTGFVALDQVISLLPVASRLRAVAAALIAVLIGEHFAYAWKRLNHDPTEPATAQYAMYSSKFAPAPAIFVDQFTLIAYYTQTSNWQWKFRRHLREPNRVDEYQLTTRSGRHITLFRDVDTWNFDLHHPYMYRVLAALLRDTNVTSADVFLSKQAKGQRDAVAISEEASEVRRRAAAVGLRVGSLYDDNEQAAISFALQ